MAELFSKWGDRWAPVETYGYCRAIFDKREVKPAPLGCSLNGRKGFVVPIEPRRLAAKDYVFVAFVDTQMDWIEASLLVID